MYKTKPFGTATIHLISTKSLRQTYNVYHKLFLDTVYFTDTHCLFPFR